MPPPTQPYFYLPDGEQEKGSDGEKESKEQRFKVFHWLHVYTLLIKRWRPLNVSFCNRPSCWFPCSLFQAQPVLLWCSVWTEWRPQFLALHNLCKEPTLLQSVYNALQCAPRGSSKTSCAKIQHCCAPSGLFVKWALLFLLSPVVNKACLFAEREIYFCSLAAAVLLHETLLSLQCSAV